MTFLAIIVILIMFIVLLIATAVMQLKMAGIKVRDFYSFICANDKLDKLYVFAQRYNKMSPQEQLIYLVEAERMFDAFDKIPESVWEEEHDKYAKVLDTYKSIKIMRWNESQEYALAKTKRIKPQEMKLEKGTNET